MTVKTAIKKEVAIIKSNGERENFNASKLQNSLLKAGASPKTIDEIISHIESEVSDGMSTSQIYSHAFFLLRKIERPVSLKYSLKRAIMDLGPSGFPFEDFISEVFKQKGFSVEIGKIVRGNCVDHEVDVIAYNENKLIMVEAKFHNELGMKSDLKTALYVKSRFDDLKQATFSYGKERSLDEGWLVTNTKFSSAAIQYGKCQSMIMIGWNYPEKGNLQHLIEDSGLHPLTCLTTLSTSEKNTLLKKGIVLCKTIAENKESLLALGMDEERIKDTLEEISLLNK